MKHLLFLLLLSLAPLAAQDLITEADTIWTRSYGQMTDANFSPDGSRLAVTEPGAYYVYDSFTGEELFREFDDGSSQYHYTNFLDNDNLILRKYGSALIHNINTDKITYFQDGNKTPNTLNRFYLNRELNLIYFLTGYDPEDRRVEVWDYKNMKFVGEFFVGTIVLRMAISNDKNSLAVITEEEGLDDKWWNLDLYDISEDGLPKNKQVLLSRRLFSQHGNQLRPTKTDFSFSDGDEILRVPLHMSPAYYDFVNKQLFKLNISDFSREGFFYLDYFFYINWQQKLSSKNLLNNEIQLITEFQGFFTEFSSKHFLVSNGADMYIFNEADIMDFSSVDIPILPLEINASFIAVEPEYEIQLLDISGNNYSDLINNNRIDRSRLPNGTYFLTIQKGDYNKVFKFIEVR